MAAGPAPLVMVLSPTADEHWSDLLTVSAALEDAFETVFAEFAPFRGRTLDIRLPGRGRLPRNAISVVYPDTSPAAVSWVEPAAPPRGAPKMRLKARSSDPRLLGDDGFPATLIPHELAHALHFWLMPRRWRIWVEARYGGWIAGQLARGGDARHAPALATSPLVAWLEAFGLFAERYWRFRKSYPHLTSEVDSAFVAHELGQPQTPGGSHAPGMATAGQMRVEGEIYRRVFVEYAGATSLATAVTLYLFAGARGITSYAGFAAALSSSPKPLGPPASARFGA